MTNLESWEHLTPPERIRERAKSLAGAHRQMLSELVTIRKARGMKQSHIAEILEISQQAVSKLESYDSNPTLATLERYANAVGATLDISVRVDEQPVERSHNYAESGGNFARY